MTRLKLLLAVFAAALFSTAVASDYPMEPDEKDKLCDVIGDTPNIAVPPRDRLWFRENCTCYEGLRCGYLGSAAFRSLAGRHVEAARQAEENRKRAAAEQREAARKRVPLVAKGRAATVNVRAAFWKCSNTSGLDCTREIEALEAACKTHKLRIRQWDSPADECYGDR